MDPHIVVSILVAEPGYRELPRRPASLAQISHLHLQTPSLHDQLPHRPRTQFPHVCLSEGRPPTPEIQQLGHVDRQFLARNECCGGGVDAQGEAIGAEAQSGPEARNSLHTHEILSGFGV